MFYRNVQKFLLNECQFKNSSVLRGISSSIDGPYRNSPYEQIFEHSIKQPEDFWAEQAERLVWFKKFNRVLDNSHSPFTKWQEER